MSAYAAAWVRYRRIRLVTILLIVTLPVAPGLAALLPEIAQAGAGVLIFGLWMAAIVVMATRWAYFPCPRCGKKFRKKAGMHVRACHSCGLLMFAESEAEAAPADYPKHLEAVAASADSSYVEAWRTYHRLQLLRSPWIVVGAILVPAIVVPQFGSQAVALVWIAWAFGWFIVYASSRVRLRAFRCPRCKHRFHGGVDITKAEWCNHCRLRLYALADPDAKNALP